jgi:peptidoglycan-associated lipoprotein
MSRSNTALIFASFRGGALAVLASILAGCATPPPPPPPAPKSYLVLLNNADGTTGQVRVTTPAGETSLTKALQATRLTGPPGATFEASQEKINQDFGPVIAAMPKTPISFLLYFAAGGARLTADSEAAIPKILDTIASREAADISVIGHTDTAGDADANEKLGLERARFVAGLLSASKIEKEKVSIESHGEKNLLIATPDNTNEPRNRRVEVTIR